MSAAVVIWQLLTLPSAGHFALIRDRYVPFRGTAAY